MARKTVKKQRAGRRAVQQAKLPLTSTNYRLFAVAAIVLLIGYWALAQEPVDGFLTLTVAPILLVIGYCVLIPLAIMWGNHKESENTKEKGTVV